MDSRDVGAVAGRRVLARGRLVAVLAAAAAAALLTLPAAASAASYCAPSPCSPGTQHATIEAAVAAAALAAGPDTVHVKAGTHVLNNTSGTPPQGLVLADLELDLVGAGVGQTILTMPATDPASGAFSRAVVTGAANRIADLTLRLPSDQTATNSSVIGADMASADLERVRIDDVGASFGPDINDGQGAGLRIGSGVLRDVDVLLAPSKDTTGMLLFASLAGQTIEAERLTVTARTGGLVAASASDPSSSVRVRKADVHSRRPFRAASGTVAVSDSLLRSVPSPPVERGVVADRGVSLELDRVTLLGGGTTGSQAIHSDTYEGKSTSIDTRHLVVDGYERTFQGFADQASSTIAFRMSHSNADDSPSAVVVQTFDGGSFTTELADNVAGDPKFNDPATGDYRLTFDSPGVDIGGADLIPGGATDLNGDPRPLGRFIGGPAINDAGAYEFQGVIEDDGEPGLERPQVSNLRLTNKRFAVAKAPTPTLLAKRKVKRGTQIRFALSAPANARLRIDRRLPGRRVKGRCVAPTRKNAKRKRCFRHRKAGVLRRRGLEAGPQRIRFTGRIGKKALKPGAYRLTVRARNAEGRSAPKRTTFRIVRAGR